MFIPSSSTTRTPEFNTQVKAGSEILEAKTAKEILVHRISTQGMARIRTIALPSPSTVRRLFLIVSASDCLLKSLGTSVLVWGTTDLTEIPIINGTGSGTTWDPKWECFVDGVSAGYTKPFPDTENNWLLCQNTQLTEGPHTLSLNVTTMGKTFWVDQLQFTPPQGSSVGNGTNVVLVDFFDPAIVYGDGWESLGSSAKMTSIYGSKLAFNFTGPFLAISKPSSRAQFVRN